MSEFEKELNKVNVYDRTGNDNALFIGAELRKHFKDWQPPKQLVEVPQCVADWFEKYKNRLGQMLRVVTVKASELPDDKLDEFEVWFISNLKISYETLIRMKLDGYTVKKEQLYYVEFNKSHDYSFLPTIDEWLENSELTYQDDAGKFTEKEIKAIDERYWPFAVKVDEVEE